MWAVAGVVLLAGCGAGVYGDDGFQAVYGSGSGADLRLTVERRGLTADTCASLPVPAAQPAGAPVTCERDGGGWRRESGDRAEYAAVRGHLLVRASGRARDSTGSCLTVPAQ
jgi:hypothetical protein